MRRSTFTLAIFLTVSSPAAFAYFDPGTGSLLIQGLIGALAAVAMFWSNLKVRLRSLFSKGKAEPPRTDIEDDKLARDLKNAD